MSAETSPRPRSLSDHARQFAAVVVGLAALFYAPLAITYFINGPEAERLQDDVLAIVVSPSFAFGLGSGYDGHIPTYVEAYATMFVHAVVGGVTLLAGAVQFSDRIRMRFPRFHRVTGRVFVLGAVIVSLSAASFLLQTPDDKIFSGIAFAEVLWLLAFATLVAPVLAVVAIIKREVAVHRELMALSYALIFSAPFLRLGWMGLGQVWDATKEMINLTEGAWAGPFLVSWAIVYSRKYGAGRHRESSPLATPLAFRRGFVASGLGVLVMLAYATRTDWSAAHPEWFTPGWGPLLALALAPFLLQAAWFAVMAARADARGDLAGRTAWLGYLLGMVWAPAVSALFLVFAFHVHGAPLGQAWWAAPLGWNVTLTVAYVLHSLSTSRTFAKDRADRELVAA